MNLWTLFSIGLHILILKTYRIMSQGTANYSMKYGCIHLHTVLQTGHLNVDIQESRKQDVICWKEVPDFCHSDIKVILNVVRFTYHKLCNCILLHVFLLHIDSAVTLYSPSGVKLGFGTLRFQGWHGCICVCVSATVTGILFYSQRARFDFFFKSHTFLL